MKPGTISLKDKSKNVQYMDTFLFEADDVDKRTYMLEEARLTDAYNNKQIVQAQSIYIERLRLQLSEASRLFSVGIAARVVYSGSKSYHILVRIKDTPSTLEEYKWLHANLCTLLSNKLKFDPSTADPARLTRAPITKIRYVELKNSKLMEGTQALVYENWDNVFNYSWRALYKQWLNRPLADYEQKFGRRLHPTKPEYKEAMYALLAGTFWTDPKWHGQRQQCFFAGYRLCRYLGYSHAQLWAADGILESIDKYYRRDEIEYWRTREKSDIICKIDQDIDVAEQEEQDG